MKALSELPEGYREICAIDLQTNKKLSLFVNGIALAIAAVMVAAMQPFVSFFTLFDASDGLMPVLLKYLLLLIGMVVYMVLHELVHGAAMKLSGTQKVRYGFTGLYAFAGSDDYYDKKHYIFIALAPVVLWGIVLLILNFFVPLGFFWVVYFIQIINLSGAAGDLFVTVKFSRMPKDILIRDYGVGMHVYSAE